MPVNINGTTGVSAVQATALANTITTTMLQANSVNSQIIAAGSVTSSQLAANAANANITTGSLYPSQFAYPFTGLSANNGASTIVGSTNVTYTGIPSWVKRITVSFFQISTSSTSVPGVQLGTSGGFATSGYLGGYQYGSSATFGTITGILPAWHRGTSGTSEAIILNQIITLVDSTTNKWMMTGVTIDSKSGSAIQLGGSITLSGTLTQLRAVMVNGTDTFSAGTINVMYE